MSETKKECNIPKIIFQTWKNNDIPTHWLRSQTELKRLYPDWKYVFHTDIDNRNFIREHYSWFLDIYDRYPYPIMRADAVRYFWLYHYGGLYIDMDIIPACNFQWLFEENDNEVYLPITPNMTTFTNCIMASKAQAPFWLDVFKLLQQRNDWPWWYIPFPHFRVIFKTGPMLIDGAVKGYKKPIGLLQSNIISQDTANPHIKDNSYTIAVRGKSWNRWDSYMFEYIFNYKGTLITCGILLIFYWIFMYNYYKYSCYY